MSKHESVEMSLSDIACRIMAHNDLPWNVAMMLGLPGEAELEEAIADAHASGDDAAEDAAVDALYRLREDYLADHGDDMYAVSWPDHVTYPRYNSDASYTRV